MELAHKRLCMAAPSLIVAVASALPACTYDYDKLECESAAIVDGERVVMLHRDHFRPSWMGESPTLLSRKWALARHRLDGPDGTLETLSSSGLAVAKRDGSHSFAVVAGTGTIVETYSEGTYEEGVTYYVQHFDPVTQQYTGPPFDVTPEVDVMIPSQRFVYTRSRQYMLTRDGALVDLVQGRAVDDLDVRRMMFEAQKVHNPMLSNLWITDDLAWAVVVTFAKTTREFSVAGKQYPRSEVGVAFSSRGHATHIIPNKRDGLRLLTVESIDGVLHCIYGELVDLDSRPGRDGLRLEIVDSVADIVRAELSIAESYQPYSCLMWDYPRETLILHAAWHETGNSLNDLVVWDYGHDEIRRLFTGPYVTAEAPQ